MTLYGSSNFLEAQLSHLPYLRLLLGLRNAPNLPAHRHRRHEFEHTALAGRPDDHQLAELRRYILDRSRHRLPIIHFHKL